MVNPTPYSPVTSLQLCIYKLPHSYHTSLLNNNLIVMLYSAVENAWWRPFGPISHAAVLPGYHSHVTPCYYQLPSLFTIAMLLYCTVCILVPVLLDVTMSFHVMFWLAATHCSFQKIVVRFYSVLFVFFCFFSRTVYLALMELFIKKILNYFYSFMIFIFFCKIIS